MGDSATGRPFSFEMSTTASSTLASWFKAGLGLCSLLVLGVASPSFATEFPPLTIDEYLKQLHYEAVAFRRSQHHRPLLEGKVGRTKLVFLVDTGWGFTSIDAKHSKGIKKLGEIGATLQDTALGPITNSSIGLLEKVELGRAQFFNQPARIEKFQLDFIPVTYDAVLGCDFFLRNFCLIDCGARRLYVRGQRPSAAEARAMEESFRRSALIEVPIQVKGW